MPRLRIALPFLLTLLLAECKRSAPLPALEEPMALLARPTVDGTALDVAALAGKVVVVNFWSPG